MSERRNYRRLFRLPLLSVADKEVDDEFRFHLEMRAAELMRAGRSPEAARDEASRQFGDINDARRFCHAEDRKRMRSSRRTLWFDNLRQDVLIAWRTMRRQPAFTATTVFVLAVAIG